MAFVDLWRGVLFCDVLRLEPEAARRRPKAIIPLLGYVSLPEDLRRNAKVDNDAGSTAGYSEVRQWGWIQQYEIESFRAIEDSSPPRTNLFPGHEGVYRSSFRHLLVCQSVVGLRDDGRTLYFTVKTHSEDDHPSVIAVDMVKKKILQVAPFFSRFNIIGFTYVHSRLLKYLKNIVAPGDCLCDNNLGLGSLCKMIEG
ncbi:hypothetical protein HU200_003458 [Digitaria exilis]|uniref:DUF1618 domain-containing protein n=1 Tax=Digitaria exilis TaxID=1010633 RepID=A0A835KYJ7_9POAL|nr:hypothetical protein HU200_003458 [Digitaria exilis]